MPQLFSPDGTSYRTEDLMEVTRLKAAGYTETAQRPPTAVDLQFHPEGKSRDEVLTFIAENPDQAERVIAEEKAGKNRITITGDIPGNSAPAPDTGERTGE